MEKRSVSRLSYLFAHLHLLSSDSFSSDLLSSDLFSSDSSHLCFSTVHIVGSFTSKLPSMIMYSTSTVYLATKSASCNEKAMTMAPGFRLWTFKISYRLPRYKICILYKVLLRGRGSHSPLPHYPSH